MHVTERSPVKKLIQREHHSILIVAIGSPQMSKLDEPFDLTVANVDCDAAQPLSASLARSAHPHSSGGDPGFSPCIM
jgi:hypothetical protein